MFREVKNSNNEDHVDDLVRLNEHLSYKRGVAGPKMVTRSRLLFQNAVRSL